MVDLLVLFYRLLDPSANHVARPDWTEPAIPLAETAAMA